MQPLRSQGCLWRLQSLRSQKGVSLQSLQSVCRQGSLRCMQSVQPMCRQAGLGLRRLQSLRGESSLRCLQSLRCNQDGSGLQPLRGQESLRSGQSLRGGGLQPVQSM
ncbi:hypothetical protein [Hoeflea sp.]|uniref:hypothetical protein n=1 Tax=Hoeflea sp. TaxID=1940281 RepID=UPI003B019A40